MTPELRDLLAETQDILADVRTHLRATQSLHDTLADEAPERRTAHTGSRSRELARRIDAVLARWAVTESDGR